MKILLLTTCICNDENIKDLKMNLILYPSQMMTVGTQKGFGIALMNYKHSVDLNCFILNFHQHQVLAPLLLMNIIRQT